VQLLERWATASRWGLGRDLTLGLATAPKLPAVGRTARAIIRGLHHVVHAGHASTSCRHAGTTAGWRTALLVAIAAAGLNKPAGLATGQARRPWHHRRDPLHLLPGLRQAAPSWSSFKTMGGSLVPGSPRGRHDDAEGDPGKGRPRRRGPSCYSSVLPEAPCCRASRSGGVALVSTAGRANGIAVPVMSCLSVCLAASHFMGTILQDRSPLQSAAENVHSIQDVLFGRGWAGMSTGFLALRRWAGYLPT
jgi:hypothetical protein